MHYPYLDIQYGGQSLLVISTENKRDISGKVLYRLH